MSDTHKFKLVGPDGKKRVADVMDDKGVMLLAKHYPNNRANEFLDWFTYSDNTIDGQSKKKAYELFESGMLNKLEPGSIKSLQQIHGYIYSEDCTSLQDKFAPRISVRVVLLLLIAFISLLFCTTLK